MSVHMIDPITEPEPFDSSLRWLVPSDSDPHEAYLIDLGSYRGNGECQCKNFCTAREPFLKRGIPPERAIVESIPETKVGPVKLKPGERVRDALRCKHIMSAYHAYAQLSIDSEVAAEEAHAVAAGQ